MQTEILDHGHIGILEALFCLHEACFETTSMLAAVSALAAIGLLTVLRPLLG